MSEQDPAEPYAGVPANVRTLIDHVGIIDEEHLDLDAKEMLKPAHLGLCMTCGTELGESTVLVVNSRGIGATYCGGACMQDMAVLGWLQEEHDDIVDRVKFRGGEDADKAE